METVKIGERVNVQFLKNKNKILVTREKIDGKERKIHVQIRLIEKALKSRQLLEDGELILAEGNWKIGTSLYGGEEYVSFISEDEEGQRIPYACFNLTYKELENLGQELKKRPAESSEILPKGKRQKTTTQEIYRWEASKNGQIVKTSSNEYLSFKKCQLDAQSINPEGEYVINFSCDEAQCPSPWELVERVYQYLIKQEFETRIKNFCPGCKEDDVHDSQSPFDSDSHLNGCSHSMTRSGDASHMHAAHIRISHQRLLEATHQMASLFKLDQKDLPRSLVFEYLKDVGEDVQDQALVMKYESEMSSIDQL